MLLSVTLIVLTELAFQFVGRLNWSYSLLQGLGLDTAWPGQTYKDRDYWVKGCIVCLSKQSDIPCESLSTSQVCLLRGKLEVVNRALNVQRQTEFLIRGQIRAANLVFAVLGPPGFSHLVIIKILISPYAYVQIVEPS
jgi:hypothetical protein